MDWNPQPAPRSTATADLLGAMPSSAKNSTLRASAVSNPPTSRSRRRPTPDRNAARRLPWQAYSSPGGAASMSAKATAPARRTRLATIVGSARCSRASASRLSASRYEPHDAARAIDRRHRQRHPAPPALYAVTTTSPVPPSSRCAWENRGRMTVVAEPQMHHVELGRRAGHRAKSARVIARAGRQDREPRQASNGTARDEPQAVLRKRHALSSHCGQDARPKPRARRPERHDALPRQRLGREQSAASALRRTATADSQRGGIARGRRHCKRSAMKAAASRAAAAAIREHPHVNRRLGVIGARRVPAPSPRTTRRPRFGPQLPFS